VKSFEDRREALLKRALVTALPLPVIANCSHRARPGHQGRERHRRRPGSRRSRLPHFFDRSLANQTRHGVADTAGANDTNNWIGFEVAVGTPMADRRALAAEATAQRRSQAS